MSTPLRQNGPAALHRRAFLGRGVSVAGALAAFPALVPSSVLGLDGAPAPSERITVGFIGCGGRMGAVMDEFLRLPDVRAGAVCDPCDPKREAFRVRAGLPESASYRDFREVLARPDIDAVAIATPDHWHVPQSIAAMRAGKDVYCEKPLCNTVSEGRALVETARRTGAVFQHGTQLHSYPGVRKACELVRNGYIGNLREIVIGSPPGMTTGLHAEMPVPADLDYDLWLGPAPRAPYTRARVFHENGFPGWYFISDYSKSGWIAGYGVHDLDIAQWGMGCERTGPIRIEGEGVYPAEGLFDTITTYRIEFAYANGVRLTMTDTGSNRHGVLFVGDEGKVFTRGGLETEPGSLAELTVRPAGTHLYRSPGHARNFIDCVKSRGETITSPEIAHRATSTALLGGIACSTGRPLRWDPERERFPEDEAANRLLRCALREPWTI